MNKCKIWAAFKLVPCPHAQNCPFTSSLTKAMNTLVVIKHVLCLTLNVQQMILMNVSFHNYCVCTRISRQNCCMLSPQVGIQNTYQVQALRKWVHVCLVGSWTLSRRFSEPDHSFESAISNLVSSRRGFLCYNNSKYKVSSSFPFPSSVLLCISWVFQSPRTVFQVVCSPCVKSSLSIALLLFPLNFLCYLLCLLLFRLCHQKLTPYSLPISLCLSAHSSASWGVMVNGRAWKCYLICSCVPLHTDTPLLMKW